MAGIGIPVTINRDIYGEDMELTITPLRMKDAKKLDGKGCEKQIKSLELLTEQIDTYSTASDLTADERKEYRDMLKEKRSLVDEIEKCAGDKEKKATTFLRKIVSPKEVCDALIDSVGAEVAVGWVMNEYQAELGK